MGRRGRIRVLAGASAVLAILALAGCSGRGASTPRSLILVSVDTLRPDRLGCYGNPGGRTPFWDRLARRGAQFRIALSAAPATLPSLGTILTGEYPFVHGARKDASRGFDPPGLTLAETLGGAGLRCAAFPAPAVLDSPVGLAHGFERIGGRDSEWRSGRRPAAVVRSALDWTRSLESEARYFLFVHLQDSPGADAPPAPWGRDGTGDPRDREITRTDRELTRLLRGLETDGRLDLAMIVALSDHGEAFGEHGETGHGSLLYETTLRVPLVVWGPRPFREGRVRGGVARTIDLFPTILDAFRIGPDYRLPGRRLQERPGPRSEIAAYAEALPAAPAGDRSGLRALRRGDWKYIHCPGAEELYDLSADPGETVNLSEERPDRARELRDRLSALAASDPEWIP